jgi:hypothetical protein
MVRRVSHSPNCQAEDHYLFAAHNSLFTVLTAIQYLEAICIHNLKRRHAIMMDPLVMDVVTV